MTKLITKHGCCRCAVLVSKLSGTARMNVIELHGTECCGFIGLGDFVEAVIHSVGLHKLWAWLHGKPSSWVCPGCQSRKTWLNNLWYFGPKSTKSIWKALVSDETLPVNAQYPFLMTTYGCPYFSEVSDKQIEYPAQLNKLLESYHE